jgi:excisionase family DNA binding protein
MRKKSEIKRAIEALRQKCDHISQAKLQVLEGVRSEQWVFDNYVKIPEEEQDEEAFFAARDAAQFVAGKIGISAICPELEDEEPDDDPEEEIKETIILSRSEYESLLKRLERVERRLGLITHPSQHRNISKAPEDLIHQSEACRYVGCGRSTIKRWAKKGLITGYVKGRSILYSKKELDKSEVVIEYRASMPNNSYEYRTDNRTVTE